MTNTIDPVSRFDELYELHGAAKAYYLACAFTSSNTIPEFWAACRMFNSCVGFDLGAYIGGYLFPEEDSAGMSEGQYDVWRVEAWEFRMHLERNPQLTASWAISL
jgi:hypothetical protein